MTDGVQIALITGTTTAISAIAVAFINNRIGRVEKKVNGRMDELLEITRKSSNAEGNLEGRADLKHEQQIDNDTK